MIIKFNKEINSELFPYKTYSSVLEQINKLHQGSVDNFLATNKIKCFKCKDLKTVNECTETKDSQIKRLINFVCCQCSRLKYVNYS